MYETLRACRRASHATQGKVGGRGKDSTDPGGKLVVYPELELAKMEIEGRFDGNGWAKEQRCRKAF